MSLIAPLVPTNVQRRQLALPRVMMAEVATHDSLEDLWFVVNGIAYDASKFATHHPGGATTLLAVGGRDATDAFENYHSAFVHEKLLPMYAVGVVVDPPQVPPHVVEFRTLRQQLLRQGLFETDPLFYVRIGAWLLTLFVSALSLSLCAPSTWTRLLGAVVMGVFWQQLAGVGHDLGHSGVGCPTSLLRRPCVLMHGHLASLACVA